MLYSLNFKDAENSLFYSQVLSSAFALRYNGIIERNNWESAAIKVVEDSNGVKYEHDNFDDEHCIYLVYYDELTRQAQATVRMRPTSESYMLENWKLLFKGEPPKDPRVWEASRIVINNSLPSVQRELVKGQLVAGHSLYALENNIDYIIGVMPPLIIASVYERSGYKMNHGHYGLIEPDGDNQITILSKEESKKVKGSQKPNLVLQSGGELTEEILNNVMNFYGIDHLNMITGKNKCLSRVKNEDKKMKDIEIIEDKNPYIDIMAYKFFENIRENQI